MECGECEGWRALALVSTSLLSILLLGALAWLIRWRKSVMSLQKITFPLLRHQSRNEPWRKGIFTRSMKPPTCSAKPKWNRFACFISHYKAEAGSDARYLSELISRIIEHRVFLDATDLHDLSLISEAVSQSDALVCLATPGYFTRPFCLVEILEAYKAGVPAILLNVKSCEFDAKDASLFSTNLRAELHRRAPECLATLHQLATLQSIPFDEYMAKLNKAVTHLLETTPKSVSLFSEQSNGSGLSESQRRYAEFLSFDSNGSHNALVADAQELIESIASVTGRHLEWDKHETEMIDVSTARHSSLSFKGLHTPELLAHPSRKLRISHTMSRMTSESTAGIAYHFAFDFEARKVQESVKGLSRRLASTTTGQMLLTSFETEMKMTADRSADEMAAALDAWLASNVGRSKGVLLVQTRRVLRHPIILVEVFYAVRHSIAVSCLNLVGGGYSFVAAQKFLAELSEHSLLQHDEAQGRTVLAWLGKEGVSFPQFKWLLYATIPNILSIRYSSSKSVHHQTAVTLDVREQMQVLTARAAEHSRSVEANVNSLIRLELTVDAILSHSAVLRLQAMLRGRRSRQEDFVLSFHARTIQNIWRRRHKLPSIKQASDILAERSRSVLSEGSRALDDVTLGT
ncbi:hypothetical protein AB1Y20_002789 [Prymnesium parvum]|uniref:TIR domain-containing protein n=1 Tax=Prymnesium parvum TaxID=97485 RepID=A0AB34JBY8_PRYPA